MGFLSCLVDPCVCFFAAPTVLITVVCGRVETRNCDSSRSALLPQTRFDIWGLLCISIQILKLFILVLWKMPLVFWQGLHWICRLSWIVWSFLQHFYLYILISTCRFYRNFKCTWRQKIVMNPMYPLLNFISYNMWEILFYYLLTSLNIFI